MVSLHSKLLRNTLRKVIWNILVIIKNKPNSKYFFIVILLNILKIYQVPVFVLEAGNSPGNKTDSVFMEILPQY